MTHVRARKRFPPVPSLLALSLLFPWRALRLLAAAAAVLPLSAAGLLALETAIPEELAAAHPGPTASAGLAPAAADPASKPEKLELLLWRIPYKGSMDAQERARREVFDLFLQKYPHISVRTVVPLRIQGAAAEGNEFLAIAGGTAPDVFDLYGRKVGDYIDQGFLAPLNANFKRDFADAGRAYSGIDAPDKIWEIGIRGENIYAVPATYYFMALMYRKDLFAKAGLDPNEPPKDWDDMWAKAKRLTYIPAKEPNPPPDAIPVYGYALLRGAFEGWHFLQYIWSAGGKVVESYRKNLATGEMVPAPQTYFPFSSYGIQLLNQAEYEDKYKRFKQSLAGAKLSDDIVWRLECNDSGGVAALEFVRKLAVQKWVRFHNPDGSPAAEVDITPEVEAQGFVVSPVDGSRLDLRDPSNAKRVYVGVSRSELKGAKASDRYEVAMKIGTLGEVVQGMDFSQWSVSAFPSLAGHPHKSFIAGWYLGVNRTSPPNRQAAAWEYIKFMTGEEATRKMIQALVENGLAQYVRPIYLKKYGYEDYYRDLPEQWIQLYNDVSASAEVEPYCRGFTHVMTVGLAHPIDTAILYPDAPAKPLLDDLCREANANILGRRPESQMRVYRFRAYVAIGVAALLLLSAMAFLVWKKMSQERKAVVDYIPGMSNLRRSVYAWSFLSIAVLLVAVWQYYPLVKGSIMAFQEFKILSGGRFVGPDNFISVFLKPEFYQFLAQTFMYVGLSIAMGFLVPIFLAILLTEIPRGTVLFRTLYYLPAVTSGLVTMFLWKQLLFDPSPSGAVNSILDWFGIPPQTFLEDPALAMVCIIIPGIWAHAGPGCLIYLAALKTISEEQYEAADLDGAGVLQKFWHVMVPNLKALLLINFLGAFVGAFQASENIFVMTGGGPINSTMTIGLDIWYNSFLYLNFGFATAEAWILGSLLIGFTVLQLQVLGKVQFRTVASGKEK